MAFLTGRSIVDSESVHVHSDKSIRPFLIETARQWHGMFYSGFSVFKSVVDALFQNLDKPPFGCPAGYLSG